MNFNVKNEVLKVCDVEISYRPKVKPGDRPLLRSSLDIFMLLMENQVFNPDTIEYKEYFKVLLLNRSNKVLGVLHLSEGSIDETVVDVRHIMQGAILANSSMIILCHNHPSGKINPSSGDDKVTVKVKKACELFGILLLDHLIVTPYSYYSYADEGRLTC